MRHVDLLDNYEKKPITEEDEERLNLAFKTLKDQGIVDLSDPLNSDVLCEFEEMQRNPGTIETVDGSDAAWDWIEGLINNEGNNSKTGIKPCKPVSD